MMPRRLSFTTVRCSLLLAAMAASVSLHGSPAEAPSPVTGASRQFMLETMVDFPDDALTAGRVLTPQDIDALMAKLAELGVRRVSWGYYADGRGGFLNPSGFSEDDTYHTDSKVEWKYFDATYRLLGNPLKVAVEAGHRHGLEVYAYYKPYETGGGIMFPEGSEPARKWGRMDCIGGKFSSMDPFVFANPDLRIKRRTDDIPSWAGPAAVHTIRLTKSDAAPTRLDAAHLEIWTSPNNFGYQPKPVKFAFAESVEPAAREVRDHFGNVLTRRGDPVRVLTLSGLNLEDKYILVASSFSDGKPDFVNSGLALMTALDAQGREIPGVFASGGAVWAGNLVDFRTAGLMFDYGWGAAPIIMDASNTPVDESVVLPPTAAKPRGKQGFIAFARGRNSHLPGALCETDPRVRAFWLQCIDEMIAAGVDGVDFREENHSTMTDHPEDYGFNDAILEKARLRKGDLLHNIAEVRGEAYTEFLRECHHRLAKAGKAMRYNLQVDYFRPDPPPNRLPAYPANVHFEWQRWLDEGLLDGVILRFFALPFSAIFEDHIAQKMIASARQRGLPVTVNRYVESPELSAELQRVKAAGHFAGFIFYEVNSYIKFGRAPGECALNYAPVEKALTEVRPGK
ncbi:MAG: hypothetical protein PSU94_01960 [Lacunisphaera sp.]|nr:hypothetical protein [Lacunisphaera sp.]